MSSAPITTGTINHFLSHIIIIVVVIIITVIIIMVIIILVVGNGPVLHTQKNKFFYLPKSGNF